MASRCNVCKRNGSRCGANAQPGKKVCIFHDPSKTEQGRIARKTGGINRSRPAAVLPPETQDKPLGNTQDVSALLGESINQVRRGQLDPRVANTVGYLANILLGALQQGPLEDRIAKLEANLGTGDKERSS
jgi:hypothetical protein